MDEQKIKELIVKIRKHDSEKAFQKLYNLCYERFFRTAYFYLQKDEWAQEVTLDVLLKLWNNRKDTIIPDNFKSYSFILVKNASLNYLEKENKRSTTPIETISEPLSSESSPEEILLHEELFQIYIEALEELPEKCKKVFVLIKEDKQSYAQVADILGISIKTVDSHLQKAIFRIKMKINNYLAENK